MANTPKIEIYKDGAGGYRFRLKDGNGEKIAASESYSTASSAKRGAENLKTTAPSAVIVDLT